MMPETKCCGNSPCGFASRSGASISRCRYGGEEFVVVMPETSLAVATMVAERLRRVIASEPFVIGCAQRFDVTISVGIAALGGSDDAASVIKRADQALYRAKRDGRNRVVPDAA